MFTDITQNKEKLLLAQAFLLAANKCKISLRDRRELIIQAISLQNLMQHHKKGREESEASLREDVFISFQITYREVYKQLQSENKNYPAELTVSLCNDSTFLERLKEIDSCQ